MPTAFPEDIANTTDSSARWCVLTRILFRLSFCYFLLYIVAGKHGTPLGLLPGVGETIDNWLQTPMDMLAQWVGVHTFHLTGSTATLHIQATGDGALQWVAVAVIFALAVGATLAWTALDRRRREYVVLLGWFRFILRLALGVELLKYGFIKVFPIQFPPPSLALLNEPVGNSSATMLFWTVYGLNPSFMMILGWTEIFTGLFLLFRRTAFLGALLAVGVMGNIALLDISFDVPVKLHSLSLLAMAMILIVPELGLLTKLFWTRQAVIADNDWGPCTARRTVRRALLGIELAIALLGCYQLASGTWHVWKLKESALLNPAPITGAWKIDAGYQSSPASSGLIGGNGLPIEEIYFDANSDVMLRGADGSLWRSRAIYDRTRQELRLLYAVMPLSFSVNQPDADHLILTPLGTSVAKCTLLRMTRVKLAQDYPLLHREFHWVNDWEPLR